MANVFADFGTPVHSSGGETFVPSQVYPRGIAWPSLNALLVSLMLLLFSFIGVGAVCWAGTGDRFAQLTNRQIATLGIIKVLHIGSPPAEAEAKPGTGQFDIRQPLACRILRQT